jgi:hypothetical protein
MSNMCKTNIMLIVFEDAKAWAKSDKSLRSMHNFFSVP